MTSILNMTQNERLESALASANFSFKKRPDRSVAVFTSISRKYLPKARILAKTLKSFHPEWDFHILLNDAWDGSTLADVDQITPINELRIDFFASWLFCYDAYELSTATRPLYVKALLNAGYTHVIFFDPDIAIYHSLDELIDRLGNSDVLLTPHTTRQALRENEISLTEMSMLAHGTFNLGFIAFRNTVTAHAVADFWAYRLARYATRDYAKGLFTDQKWVNLVPVFFDNVEVLKHEGCNVASWNISQRAIVQKDGLIYAGKDPLLFFHFSGYDAGVPETMFRQFGSYSEELAQILHDYKVENHTMESITPEAREKWAFEEFDNGHYIPYGLRIYYRETLDVRFTFRDPFSVSSGMCFWNHVRQIGIEALCKRYDPPGMLNRHY